MRCRPVVALGDGRVAALRLLPDCLRSRDGALPRWARSGRAAVELLRAAPIDRLLGTPRTGFPPPPRLLLRLPLDALSGRRLVDTLVGALAEAGLTLESLAVEVDMPPLPLDGLPEGLVELQAGGAITVCSNFAPDFSIRTLVEFPFDYVRVHADCASPELLKAVVAVAGALDMAVIADGVDTEEQAARLRELGFHLGEGRHLGGDLVAAQFPEGPPARSGSRALR